jgi:hypothetical protein
MMKTIHGLIWSAVTSALVASSAVASNAQALLEEFEADRNTAYKQYRGNEMSVSGKITRTLKALGGMEITLDDAVTVKIGREHDDLVRQIEEAAKAENDRVDKAREWQSNYVRQQRRSSGGKKGNQGGNKKGGKGKGPYKDSMNPHGPPKENLNLSLTASGTCKGIRNSKILLQPVSSASLSVPVAAKAGGKGKKGDNNAKKKAGGKSAEMEAALKRTSWTLKGTIYVENGQKYFAPDKSGLSPCQVTLAEKRSMRQ